MKLLSAVLVLKKAIPLFLFLAAALVATGCNSNYRPGVPVSGGVPPLKTVTYEDSAVVSREITQAALTPQ